MRIVLLKPLKDKKVGTHIDMKEIKKNTYGSVMITEQGEVIELPSDFTPSWFGPVVHIKHDMEQNVKTKNYQERNLGEDSKDEEFSV